MKELFSGMTYEQIEELYTRPFPEITDPEIKKLHEAVMKSLEKFINQYEKKET